ncbi:MAG: shikimate kinase [Spirochaetia bacterium]|nr:shikimate kinase [Spirochaetia bacterium]
MDSKALTPQHLFLTGLKHCGKTTLGSMLAARCGRLFFDLDELLLQEARPEGYSSVREIYRTAGRKKFQEYEARAAEKACVQNSTPEVILSLGGGTIENPAALETLKPAGSFIYLHVEEEVLFERIQRGGLPPFLIGDQPPQEMFHELWVRRHQLYLSYADLVLTLPNQAVEDNFKLLYTQLKEHNYVG